MRLMFIYSMTQKKRRPLHGEVHTERASKRNGTMKGRGEKEERNQYSTLAPTPGAVVVVARVFLHFERVKRARVRSHTQHAIIAPDVFFVFG